LPAWNVNGDAFSVETKSNINDIVKNKLDTIDFLVYSIAAPRRIDPATGEIYSSVIKPIGKPFSASSLDFLSGVISEVSAEPATAEQIAQTVKVMGGEDWMPKDESASMTGRCDRMSSVKLPPSGKR
jgi:enoyl-[acyl-carrier protein] reductase/trans-2-enoyl-CoA reductase (NAD+)